MHQRARILSCFIVMATLGAAPAHAQIYADVNMADDGGMPNDDSIFSPPPVAVAPPALPDYVVPPPPSEDLVWQPGYWRWDGYGWFWVPGTWVAAPITGMLWTPGYWAWNGYAYVWSEGYWGESVGYYGGINYGGGYDGRRFYGGSWVRGHYECNPAILRARYSGNFVSFNGGAGGVVAVITVEQERASHERHYQLTQEQREHTLGAARDPSFRSASNHGRPPVAATLRPGDFAHGVAASQAGPVNTAARAHNDAVRKNPALAGSAALPRQRVAQPTMARPEASQPTFSTRPTVTRVPQAEAPVQREATPEPQAERVEHVSPVERRIAKVPSMPTPEPQVVTPQVIREPVRPEPVQQPHAVQQPQAVHQEQHHEAPQQPQHPAPAAQPQAHAEPQHQEQHAGGHGDGHDNH